MTDLFQKPVQLSRAQVRRRSTAKKNRLHRSRLMQSGQFSAERIDIGFNEMVVAVGDGKIAVATMMRTKRHVNVGRARKNPAGVQFGHTFSLEDDRSPMKDDDERRGVKSILHAGTNA